MAGNITLKEVNNFLLCGVLIVAAMFFAQKILIPITFAIFFAMLFTPLSNKMEKRKVPRWLTAIISCLIIVLVTAGIGVLVYMQSKKLADQFPEIEKKSKEFVKRSQDYINKKLNIPEKKQDELVNKHVKTGFQSSGNLLKKFVAGFAGIVAAAILVLIITFLFLLQREKYESFFLQLMDDTPSGESKKVIGKIAKVAQSYLTGRVLSILIFTALFTTGFLIVGLESAFLLAFIAALLTIVPYVGSIIGGLFPFAVALVTGDTNTAIGALVVVFIVQTIDNYFIEPYVIGGEVHISGLFTILILLIGGMIWGVAGMILFLPLLAVARIVFDHVPELKPYAYLIGDQGKEKQSSVIFDKLKSIFKKK